MWNTTPKPVSRRDINEHYLGILRQAVQDCQEFDIRRLLAKREHKIMRLYSEGTFCLLTKDSDGVVSSIHNRMPVLIPKERYAEWFKGGREEARHLIAQCNGLALTGHRVSMKINSPANNQGELLASI